VLYGYQVVSLFEVSDSRCNMSYSVFNPLGQSEELYEQLEIVEEIIVFIDSYTQGSI